MPEQSVIGKIIRGLLALVGVGKKEESVEEPGSAPNEPGLPNFNYKRFLKENPIFITGLNTTGPSKKNEKSLSTSDSSNNNEDIIPGKENNKFKM
jgi:hypothetical protein